MEKDLKVLVLEDMEEDLGLIERTLNKAGIHFQTKCVNTKEEFINALNEFDADVILSDHALPEFNSAQALRTCKKLGFSIPFIVVTGAVSEEFAVNSIKDGADNYVLKSNLTRLPSAINSAIKQHEDELAKVKANEELILQNRELVKINKELDSFVYSVSHNLKAPLMSVLGLINLGKMEDEKNGNIFTEYFNMMERSIHKLDDTLKEIIDYSRNARKELTIEQIDIRQIIQDNLERLQYMPGSDLIIKDVQVRQEFPFYSDGYRLSVIFNNIISNAIKYADPRKSDPFLRIAVAISADKATIRFEDNGIGIHQDYLAKVFNMFFRATVQKDGAGLGLYIVKEAIEKLKGTIKIDSTEDKGTTFLIEMPNHTFA